MLLARLGCAAFHGPMLGRVLGRGLSTLSTAHTAAVVVPLFSKLEPYDCVPSFGHRFGLGMATAGAVLLVAESDTADCQPKRKAKTPAAAPAAAKKKKAGPALTAIEAALQPEIGDGEYNVEAIIADKLEQGKKVYLVKWMGFADKHNSWEPFENLANLTAEIGAYHKAKEDANAAHVKKLQDEKAAREAAPLNLLRGSDNTRM